MRRLISFVLVLAVILVVVDRAACWAAQRAVAESIQTSQHLAGRPDVTVKGFPFLTQAFHGRYTEVDGTLRDLTVQDGVTVDRLDVHLLGVHLKPADVVNQRVTSAPVDSASATALVTYAALDAAAKARLSSDLVKVQFAAGPDNQVAVNGSGPLGTQLHARARVAVRDGSLVVTLVATSLAGLPQLVRSQVTALLSPSYKLPALPFGFKAQDVTVGTAGVTVRAAASAVRLG